MAALRFRLTRSLEALSTLEAENVKLADEALQRTRQVEMLQDEARVQAQLIASLEAKLASRSDDAEKRFQASQRRLNELASELMTERTHHDEQTAEFKAQLDKMAEEASSSAHATQRLKADHEREVTLLRACWAEEVAMLKDALDQYKETQAQRDSHAQETLMALDAGPMEAALQVALKEREEALQATLAEKDAKIASLRASVKGLHNDKKQYQASFRENEAQRKDLVQELRDATATRLDVEAKLKSVSDECAQLERRLAAHVQAEAKPIVVPDTSRSDGASTHSAEVEQLRLQLASEAAAHRSEHARLMAQIADLERQLLECTSLAAKQNKFKQFLELKSENNVLSKEVKLLKTLQQQPNCTNSAEVKHAQRNLKAASMRRRSSSKEGPWFGVEGEPEPQQTPPVALNDQGGCSSRGQPQGGGAQPVEVVPPLRAARRSLEAAPPPAGGGPDSCAPQLAREGRSLLQQHHANQPNAPTTNTASRDRPGGGLSLGVGGAVPAIGRGEPGKSSLGVGGRGRRYRVKASY